MLVPIWFGMWVALGVITSPWRDLLLYRSAGTGFPRRPLSCRVMDIQAFRSRLQSAQLGGFPELIPGHREQRLVDLRHTRSASAILFIWGIYAKCWPGALARVWRFAAD